MVRSTGRGAHARDKQNELDLPERCRDRDQAQEKRSNADQHEPGQNDLAWSDHVRQTARNRRRNQRANALCRKQQARIERRLAPNGLQVQRNDQRKTEKDDPEQECRCRGSSHRAADEQADVDQRMLLVLGMPNKSHKQCSRDQHACGRSIDAADCSMSPEGKAINQYSHCGGKEQKALPIRSIASPGFFRLQAAACSCKGHQSQGQVQDEDDAPREVIDK
jgi:hypothetical protein